MRDIYIHIGDNNHDKRLNLIDIEKRKIGKLAPTRKVAITMNLISTIIQKKLYYEKLASLLF